jgi:tetratricopeptide (TPR) repeat protein
MNPKIREMCERIHQIGIYTLVIIIPLVFSTPVMGVFDYTKQIVLYLGLLALVGACLVNWLGEDTRQPPVFQTLDIVLGLLVLVQIGATLLGINRTNSLFGMYGRIHGSMLAFLSFIVWFYLVLVYVRRREAPTVLISLLLAGSMIQSVLGIMQRLGLDVLQLQVRDFAIGTVGTISDLGFVALVGVMIAWWLLSRSATTQERLLYAGSSVLCFGGILAAGALSAWFGLAVMVIVWLVVRPGSSASPTSLVYWQGALAGMGALGALLFATPWLGIGAWPVREAFLPVSLGWDGAAHIARLRPLLGAGPENFTFMYTMFKPFELNLGQGWNIQNTYASTEFLSWLANLGYLGTGVFLGLIGVIIAGIAKTYQSRRQDLVEIFPFVGIVLIGMIYWFVAGASVVQMFYFWLALAFVAGALYLRPVAKHVKSSINQPTQEGISYMALVVPLLGIVIGVGVYLVGRWYQAEVHFKRHLVLLEAAAADQTQHELAFEQIGAAQRLIGWDDRYARYTALRSLEAAQIQMGRLEQAPDEQAVAEINEIVYALLEQAKSLISRATALNPYEPFNYVVAGDIILAGRETEEIPRETVANYERAIQADPTSPRYYELLGNVYAQTGEYEKAAWYLQRAIEAKYDWWLPYYELASVYEALEDLSSAVSYARIADQLVVQDETLDETIAQQVAATRDRLEQSLEEIQIEPSEEVLFDD